MALTLLTTAAARLARAFCTVLLILLAHALTSPAADAQTSPPEAAAPPPTAAEVDALLTTLEDPDARAKLISQLQLMREALKGGADAAAPAEDVQTVEDSETTGSRLLELLAGQLERVSRATGSAFAAVMRLPEQLGDAVRALDQPAERQRLLDAVLQLLLVLLPAAAVQWLIGRVLGRPWRRVAAEGARGAWRRIVLVLLRFVLRLVPIIAFGAVAYVAVALLDLRPATQVIALAAVNATIVVSVFIAVAHAILSPQVPALRLVDWDDASAVYAMTWVWRFVLVGVYGYFLTGLLAALRTPAGLTGAVARLLGLVLLGMAIMFILQNRRDVAAWLHRGREFGGLGRVRRAISEIWHILAIIAVVLVYIVWALGLEGGFEYLVRGLLFSALVLAGARIIGGLVRRGTRRVFSLSHERRAAFPGLESRVNRYLPVLENLLLAVLYVMAAILVLQVWGVPVLDWLAGPVGRNVAATAIKIVVIVALAVVLSEVVSSLIGGYLARKTQGGEPVARGARIRTLLPLLRNAFRIVLGIMVVLIILSEVGIDIAPLLAGAGVVGLAIGFGAQTLVQDVITGIFILAEDTISVGDVVDVGGHAGLVEAMSVRSLRLREFDGSVHTVPFSQVKAVKNLTKDYSYALFDVRVAYREDVDEVMEVLREIGAELQADEKLGRVILEPIEVVGLDRFAETAVIIRARIKTLPIQQWNVIRAFNRRLKQVFDERGIEIPFPYRTIVFGTDKQGNGTQARVKLEGELPPSTGRAEASPPAPAPSS